MRSGRRAGGLGARLARCFALTAFAVAASAAFAQALAAAPPAPATLDDFNDIAAWKAVASDGVVASVASARGPDGPALRLDYDLAGTAGYAIARRDLPIDFPENYELWFDIRADADVNDFQLKLIDASGDNVWWFSRRNFEFPHAWERVKVKKRQIDFAWGPIRDRVLRHAASIEIVVAAGRGGGKGSVYVGRLAMRPLPAGPVILPPPAARASSFVAGTEPQRAVDGDTRTAWRTDPSAGREQELVVDFGGPLEFGGLVLRWQHGAYASRYDIDASDDGERWRTLRRIVAGIGGPDALPLPESEARYLRLRLHDGPGRGYALDELEVKDLAFGASPNAFFQSLARDAPRGFYPRGFVGEQSSWTIVGIDGGRETGLLAEDGALEVARGGFSIEPFVVEGDRVITWADVNARPSLVGDDLPMPIVTWSGRDWTMRITSFATGTRASSQLVARYDLRNTTNRPIELTLVLGIRPFQVNPPQQFLSTPGGVSAIKDIRVDGRSMLVNGRTTISSLRTPDRVGAFPYEAGPTPRIVAARDWAGTREIRDDSGYASGALAYRVALPANGVRTVGIVVPLSGAPIALPSDSVAAVRWLDDAQRGVAATWREKLDRVSITAPAAAKPVIDTLRTSLAHILITRDGPILRPGTRSYARSWIRDGAMMAESMLRLGHADAAIDYLRWYAPHQFKTGKVPCCVDERGADPVPENDSPGEFLFLAAEIYRHTGDRALLESLWPRLSSAAQYLESLRQSERTDANLAPARRAFYGMMPPSISHEGYSEKPMHSYWDNFWALKGYDAAVEIATALGREDAARDYARQRDEFRADLDRSLREAMTSHGIAFLPGAAELGDFDPTSTTIAFAPDGIGQDLPREAVAATYERYWREFVDRRDGRKEWEDYTPYELRNVGVFVRIGWRDRAFELLDFFLAGRQPPAWNQWPEVIGRDRKKPRFIGDLPHGWIASDFIRCALDLFAYERYGDRALVLGAGLPRTWLRDGGVRLAGLRTRYGALTYSARDGARGVEIEIGGGMRIPPGGIVVPRPAGDTSQRVFVNGKAVAWQNDEIRVREVPAKIVVGAR